MRENVQRQARAVVATCLGYQTRRLARAVTRSYNDQLRSLGLNIAELNLMAGIAAHGSVQPAKLGQAMGLEKSTLSRNIGRLVDRGWVEVYEAPDGLGSLLSLTVRGNDMFLQALPSWEAAQKDAETLVAETLRDLGAR